MMKRTLDSASRRAAAFAIALAFALPTPAVAQQNPVQAGVAAGVRGDVQLARAYEGIVGRRLDSGAAIFLEDVISAGPDAAMQILLMDETVFTIGANSEIIIDEFVYDPETNVGKVTAQIVKGAFRFTTGLIGQEDPDSVSIGTPMGTIGIRGTIVAGEVGETQALIVLIGPGDEAGTKERVGRIEVGNDEGSVEISRSGYGTTMGVGAAPTTPASVPQVQIDGILSSVQGSGSDDGSDTPDEGDTAATTETEDDIDGDAESDDQSASAADGESESATETAADTEAESETTSSTEAGTSETAQSETTATTSTSAASTTDTGTSVTGTPSSTGTTTLSASVGGTSVSSLSGGLIAEAAGDAGSLETVVDGGDESSDTVASVAESTIAVASAVTTLSDLTQITTGKSVITGSGNLVSDFGATGASGTFSFTGTLDFGNQTAQFLASANWGANPTNPGLSNNFADGGSFSLDAGPEDFTTIFSEDGRTPSQDDPFSTANGPLQAFDSADNTGDYTLTGTGSPSAVVDLEIRNVGGGIANGAKVDVVVTDDGEVLRGSASGS